MLGFSRDSDQQTGSVDLNSVVEDTLKLLGIVSWREIDVKFNPAPEFASDLLRQRTSSSKFC